MSWVQRDHWNPVECAQATSRISANFPGKAHDSLRSNDDRNQQQNHNETNSTGSPYMPDAFLALVIMLVDGNHRGPIWRRPFRPAN
jgi:hypothetical protein